MKYLQPWSLVVLLCLAIPSISAAAKDVRFIELRKRVVDSFSAIDNEKLRVAAQRDFAIIESRRGDVATAFSIAGNISDETDKAFVQVDVAAASGSHGSKIVSLMLSEIRRYSCGVADQRISESLRGELAKCYAKLGQVAEAEVISHSLEDEYKRGIVNGVIIDACFKNRDTAKAFEIAQTFKGQSAVRLSLFLRCVALTADAGDVDHAISLLQSAKRELDEQVNVTAELDRANVAIAVCLYSKGGSADARRRLLEVKSVSQVEMGYTRIAAESIKLRRWNDAKALIEEIRPERRLLLEIALATAVKEEDQSRGRQMLFAASHKANDLQPGVFRAEVFRALSHSRVIDSDKDAALQELVKLRRLLQNGKVGQNIAEHVSIGMIAFEIGYEKVFRSADMIQDQYARLVMYLGAYEAASAAYPSE